MNYTRKQLIDDCVKAYIKNNPKEYLNFQKLMRQKRAGLVDRNYAVAIDDLKSSTQMRHLFTIPDKLMSAIETLLKAHNQEPFLSSLKEKIWFKRNYRQFSIADKINFDPNEPQT